KYLSYSVVLIVALLKISKDGCVQWLSDLRCEATSEVRS
ncbi:unnamed protein product, partial [Musa hybrid cultivar]